MHVYVYVDIYGYVHVWQHVRRHMQVYMIYIYIYLCKYMYIYMLYLNIHTCLYIYIHVNVFEYMYIFKYIHCPIRGYSEGLLAVDVDKRSVWVGTVSAKNGYPCVGTFLGMALKSLLGAGDLCHFHERLSLVCSLFCPRLRNRYKSALTFMFFLLYFRWLRF